MRKPIVFSMLLAITCSSAIADERTVKDFVLPSAVDGSLIHLADYSGKVILINWWRTSCAWSQQESPKLAELYRRHRDKGFVIVGVSDDTADSVAQIPAYVKRYGVTWPVGLNDQGEFMRDVRPLGQGDTPGNYLVSRSGKITYLGLDRRPEDWRRLEEAVVHALAEPAPPTSPIKPQPLVAAPPLFLPALQGTPATLATFAGKPLVVNFFNSQTCDWSGRVLSKLHADLGARGLQVVGIDLFDTDAQAKACLAKHGARYPVLKGDQTTQMAWIGAPKAWAVFFVTPDGKMLKKIIDSIDNGLEAPVFSKYAEYLLTNH